MSRHATALYCNAAPYVLYRDMSLGIIVFLMRAAIILYYQSVCVCVFFFSFLAILQPGVKCGRRPHSFELTRDKLAVIRDLEENCNFSQCEVKYIEELFYSIEHIRG